MMNKRIWLDNQDEQRIWLDNKDEQTYLTGYWFPY